MTKPVINMKSAANKIKGQGVGSCYDEHFALVTKYLSDSFIIHENKRIRSDITHYHTVNFPYFIQRVIRGKKESSICFVHFLPETVDRSIKLPWVARVVFYKYLISFYNSMDYLVAVNPTTIKKIQEAGIFKPNLCYIPNFVSEENFYELPDPEKKALRLVMGIPQDKFTVLGVGQLQTRKGVFDFIETAKRMPDIQFVWAGGFSFGKITDGYEEIKKVVGNPPENIKFLGIIDRDDMNSVFNACDLMFLPSFDELFPMSILEAMSCNKPILLRDIPVYESILEGSYMKARDVGGFCKLIEEISHDREILETWKRRSWTCHLKYNEETISQMWKVLYTCAYNREAYDMPVFQRII